MKITIKKISELKRPDRNVRLHGDKQIKEYVRSIKMFGQVRPLVIDENNVVLCGNGLLQALQTMEAETADCYVVKNLSENDKKKLMLADNKIFELGVNATDTFDEFIRELDGDIDIPGYDEEMLKILMANAKEADTVLNNYGKFSDQSVSRMEQAPSSESFNNSTAKPVEERHKLPIQIRSFKIHKAIKSLLFARNAAKKFIFKIKGVD